MPSKCEIADTPAWVKTQCPGTGPWQRKADEFAGFDPRIAREGWEIFLFDWERMLWELEFID